MRFKVFQNTFLFLSTPSARRATSTRTAQRGRYKDISIHALREEGDGITVPVAACGVTFLSTPSARRATSGHCWGWRTDRHFYPRPPRGGRLYAIQGFPKHVFISIHALREEGDKLKPGDLIGVEDFYPRPPRGGRHVFSFVISDIALFLSTPSARRATGRLLLLSFSGRISIHALREEGDPGLRIFDVL